MAVPIPNLHSKHESILDGSSRPFVSRRWWESTKESGRVRHKKSYRQHTNECEDVDEMSIHPIPIEMKDQRQKNHVPINQSVLSFLTRNFRFKYPHIPTQTNERRRQTFLNIVKRIILDEQNKTLWKKKSFHSQRVSFWGVERL